MRNQQLVHTIPIQVNGAKKKKGGKEIMEIRNVTETNETTTKDSKEQETLMSSCYPDNCTPQLPCGPECNPYLSCEPKE